MTAFTDDLEKASMSAAKVLRADVNSKDIDRKYREMRQEATFVAEVYHLLREGYGKHRAEDFFLEYVYPDKIESGDKKKKLKPDLIYEGKNGDEVVEFKVFWNGDLNGRSYVNKNAQIIIRTYFDKLLSYRNLPNNIVSLTLVFAYVGPNTLNDNSRYNLDQFVSSVMETIPEYRKMSEKKQPEIRVIVC
jgi:hypothetical protein